MGQNLYTAAAMFLSSLHLSWDFLHQYKHVKAGVPVLDNLCWAIPLKSHGSTYNYIVQTIKTFNNCKRARATGNDTGKTRVNVCKKSEGLCSEPLTPSHLSTWPSLLPRASWRAPKALLGESPASQQMPFGIDLRGFLFSAVMGCQTCHK